MKKRALVTGACGFVGSHLVDLLLEEGWEVRATDLPDVSRHWLPKHVDWVAADLTRPDTLDSAVKGSDVVFHTAGVNDASIPWERLYRVNALGTEALLEAARKAGVQRILSWSSYGVYGRLAKNCRPVDENHPVRPRDPLSRSKAIRDAVVWRYADMGLSATILRPGFIYGPRARQGMARIFQWIDQTSIVPIPRNLTQRIGTIHVKDVARAASLLAGREDTIGQEFNIVDNGQHEVHALLSLLARLLGKRTVPVLVPGSLLKAGALASANLPGGARLREQLPWLDRETARCLTSDLWASNEKVSALGFHLRYPDPEPGLRETIEALTREGLLH